MSYPQSIKFNTGVIINLKWEDFKAVTNQKFIPMQYITTSDGYCIYALEDNSTYNCNLISTNHSNDFPFSSEYPKIQNDLDINDFITNYMLICGGPSTPRLSDGRLRVSSERTNSSTITFYSHNWCDKTTWYEKANRAANEIATNSGDNLSYSLAHKFIIDSYHGKYTNEDFITDANGFSYRVSVSVDGVIKREQDPHFASGGDFIVNYEDGYVIFLSAQNLSSVITATYHYAGSSIFTIKPTMGKALKLGIAEAQFSDNVIINDSVLFQPYGFVEFFAPQYCTINGGPYPPGTKIPLGNPLIYKSIQDYFNDSKKSYPMYPAIGGNSWRGMQRPSIILDWEYEGDKILRYDQGMEIRVFLQHDTSFDGDYGTVTFYCRSENL